MLLFVLALVILLFGALVFPFVRFRMVSPEPANSGLPIIAGHRGAADVAPENTLVAFREGMKSASMIELDVHLSKDGQVIVAHDPTADRTTNGTGAWTDMTLEEIKKLDAGSWFHPSFAGEQIPTLDEVLSLVDGQCMVLIELKWPKDGTYPELPGKIIQLIHEHNAEQWTVIQSFEVSYLIEIVKSPANLVCYELIYGILSFPPIWQDRRLHAGAFRPIEGISGVVCYYPFVSAGLVDRLHSMKLKVGVYTVNRTGDVGRLQNLGVDLVITDFPDRMPGTRPERPF